MANSDDTTIIKIVDGKNVKIENAAILAKLTTLLTSNPFSESSRQLAHDTEFVRGCATGVGEYVATRKVTKGDESFVMEYRLKKSDTPKLFELILKGESILKAADSFILANGNLPKRGRKSLDADYSAL